jgi:hypothetical protein
MANNRSRRCFEASEPLAPPTMNTTDQRWRMKVAQERARADIAGKVPMSSELVHALDSARQDRTADQNATVDNNPVAVVAWHKSAEWNASIADDNAAESYQAGYNDASRRWQSMISGTVNDLNRIAETERAIPVGSSIANDRKMLAAITNGLTIGYELAMDHALARSSTSPVTSLVLLGPDAAGGTKGVGKGWSQRPRANTTQRPSPF